MTAGLVLAAAAAPAEADPGYGVATGAGTPTPPPGWDLDTFVGGLGGRAAGVIAAPLDWGAAEWAGIGLGAGLSVGAMWAIDDFTRHHLANKRRGHHSRRWAQLMGGLGDGQAYRVAALTGLGVARGARSEQLGTAVFDAWIASEAGGILGGGLQSLIGRARPRRLEGSHTFEPACGCAGAFPSVHSTRAFAVATALTLAADGWWAVPVGLGAYTFAGAIGVSRIIKDGHWASDVLAGAGLGVLIGVVVHAASVRVGPLQLGAIVRGEVHHPEVGLRFELGF